MTDSRYSIIHHGRILFDRQQRLTAAGYVAVLEERPDHIEFNHPASPSVLLWSDGRVRDVFPLTVAEDKRIDIEPEDEAGFLAFVRRVPGLSWWQRFKRQTVREIAYTLAVPAVLWLIVILASRCDGN